MRAISQSGGFTVAELMVVLVVVTVLIVPIGIIIIFFLNSTIEYSVKANLEAQAQTAARVMSDDFRGSNAVLASSMHDPSKGGTWSTSSGDGVLVVDTVAISKAGEVMMNSSSSEPYLNQIVYYLNDSTLFKRSLPASDSGADNLMVRTCRPVISGCTADAVLATGVSSFDFTLHGDNDASPVGAASAKSVEIRIIAERHSIGVPVKVEKQTRITRKEF